MQFRHPSKEEPDMLTIQIDDQTEQRLNRLSELTKIDTAELVRIALSDFIELQRDIEDPKEVRYNNIHTLRKGLRGLFVTEESALGGDATGIAGQVCEIAETLPDHQAKAVLHYAEFLSDSGEDAGIGTDRP
jgi:predicted transcriptional regulator